MKDKEKRGQRPKKVIAPEMQVKGRIMDTPTKNATIAEQTAAKKAGIGDVKGREKYQSSPFRPKATLLLDVSPVESSKPADTTRSESPEGMAAATFADY